jgi:hypothetical protein
VTRNATTTRVRKAVGRLPVRITKIFPRKRAAPPPAPPRYELADKGKPEPATRVVSVSPVQAHSIRSMFGLRTTSEQADKIAAELTQRAAKAATSDTGSPGGSTIGGPVPEAARPQILHRPLPNVTEFNSTGQRIDPTLGAMGAVLVLITQQYVANGRRSVTLDVAELSRLSGLSPDQVRSAIDALEARRVLLRDPGRLGSLPRFAPAAA